MKRGLISTLAAMWFCIASLGETKLWPGPEPSCSILTYSNAPSEADVEIEAYLQRLRYVTRDEKWALEIRGLALWLAPALDGFFQFHGYVDRAFRRKLIDECFRKLVERILWARWHNEKPRNYLKYLYHVAEQLDRDHCSVAVRRNDIVIPNAAKRVEWELGAIAPIATAYGATADIPLKLSAFQLTVLQALAIGRTNSEIAADLGTHFDTVYNARLNVLTKIQKLEEDRSRVQMGQLQFRPDLGSENRVFIVWYYHPTHTRVYVGEGPLPFVKNELEYLTLWVRGNSLSAIQKQLFLTKTESNRLFHRLLLERAQDFDELFLKRTEKFVRTFDIEIAEETGAYALLKAFGLDREEIAQATDSPVKSISTTDERLKQKMKNAAHLIDPTIDYRHLYFCTLGDSQDVVMLVARNVMGELLLFRASIRDPKERRSLGREIFVDRNILVSLIERMEGRVREVMRRIVLEGMDATGVAMSLGIRVDTVRKHAADGIVQLASALEMPELTLFDLRVREPTPALQKTPARPLYP